jgi:hypothetical protein
MDINQAQRGEQLVTQAIAMMSEYDQPNLIAILNRSGYMVGANTSQDKLINDSFMALKDSQTFRNDLMQYIQESTSSEQANFLNQTGGKYKQEHGYTRVGGFLKSLFSQENVAALTSAGIGYASLRLQQDAQKKGNQQAIDYKNAEANAALAEARRLELQGLAPQQQQGGSGTPKWVLPVAIGGGVLLIGTILFFALRKK